MELADQPAPGVAEGPNEFITEFDEAMRENLGLAAAAAAGMSEGSVFGVPSITSAAVNSCSDSASDDSTPGILESVLGGSVKLA